MRRDLLSIAVGLVLGGCVFACALLAAAPSAGARRLAVTGQAQLIPSGTGEGIVTATTAGGYVFATAPQASGPSGVDQGIVLVFAPSGATPGSALHEVAQLTPGARSGADMFGRSLAVSPDGSQVFVGADGAAAAVFAFSRPAAGWAGTLTPSARLAPVTSHEASGFGSSLALDGDTLAVGAPDSSAAYVFERPAGGWTGTITAVARLTSTAPTEVGGFGTDFGWGVDVSGSTILVGSGPDIGTPVGVADVFERPAGGWHDMTESARLVASGGTLVASQGLDGGDSSLALSGDTVAIPEVTSVGHPSRGGALLVFTRPPTGWSGTVTQSATLTMPDRSGVGSPVIDADTIFARGGEGEVVFPRPPGGWTGTETPAATLVPSDGSAFPDPVSVSDRELLAGGSLADGLAATLKPSLVFSEPSGGWSGRQTETARLAAPDTPDVTRPVSVFQRPAGGWASASPSALLTPSGDPAQVTFTSVSASASTVAATQGTDLTDLLDPTRPAPPIDVYSRGPGGWRTGTESATLSDSGGAVLSAARVSGPTVVAAADGHLDVFAEPTSGWSGAVHETATLPGATAAISGPTILSGRDVYAEPAAGWGGTAAEPARLVVPAAVPMIRDEAISGSTIALDCADSTLHRTRVEIYRRPAAGWQGAIGPSAELTPDRHRTFGASLATDGRDVAVLGDGHATRFTTPVGVFVRPRGGWAGRLHAAAVTHGQFAIGAGGSASLAIARGRIAVSTVSSDHYGDSQGYLTVDLPPARGWGRGLAPAPLGAMGGGGAVALSGSRLFLAGGGVSVATLTGSGPPAASPVTLVASSRTRLAVTAARGFQAPGITGASLTLPTGLRLTGDRRAVHVSGARVARVRARPHRLTLTLREPATQLTISLAAPGLHVAPHGHHGRTARLRVTDAAGRSTSLPLRVVTGRASAGRDRLGT